MTDIAISQEEDAQRRLLRSLMNVRMLGKISQEFLKEQDTYAPDEIRKQSVCVDADIDACLNKI